MPIHNWKGVPHAYFHAHHHAWISELLRTLNSGLLGEDFYAVVERNFETVGPDILALQKHGNQGGGTATRAVQPRPQLVFRTNAEFYRKKKSVLAVKHVSEDRTVAILEIVSAGNKGGRRPFQQFLDKCIDLIDSGIHLSLVDLHPRTARDPDGIHNAIWGEMSNDAICESPADKPLTLVSYEVAYDGTAAYVEPVGVGMDLPPMPLFLMPGYSVDVPLEATYRAAWDALPNRLHELILQSAEPLA